MKFRLLLLEAMLGIIGGMLLSGMGIYLEAEGVGYFAVLTAGGVLGFLLTILFYFSYAAVRKKSQDTVYGRVLDSVASGDLTEGALPADSGGLGDEFLWKLRDMVLNLRRVVGKVQAVSERVKEVSTEVSERSRNLMEVSRSQTRITDATFSAVEDMFESLQKVGASLSKIDDLAMDTSTELDDMLHSIDEVDRVLGELSDFVAESATAVQEMNANIAQVADNAKDLNMVTEETEVSMNAMDRDIASVEKSASEAADLSVRTAVQANEGREVIKDALDSMSKVAQAVAEVSEKMGNLDKRSEEIGSIVGMISNIADQTNLLALNASIIAAQAGERGRGFAVVASEIRSLSERTRRSTTDVADLVESVQGEIAEAVDKLEESNIIAGKGTELGAAAEQALMEILEQTKEASEQMSSIASATKRQAESSKKITKATRQVGEMVGQVSTAALEQAKTSAEIAKKARLLEELSLKAKGDVSEQANGSRAIRESMKRVTGLLEDVQKASHELSEGGDRVRVAMGEIQQQTRDVSSSSTALSNAVDQLKLEAILLDDEVHKFKLPVASRGGTVRMGIIEREVVEATRGLDPAHMTSLSQVEVLSCLYDGLVAWGEAMELVPALAENWEVGEDGRVYRFKLRTDVSFQNGRDLTAWDVKFSFQRTLDPKNDSPNSWIFTDLEGADEFASGRSEEVSGLSVLGDHEIEIRLKSPRSFFLYALTMAGAYIVSSKGRGIDPQVYSGTGPYKPAGYEKGKVIKMEKNQNYFRQDRPHLDFIEFRSGFPDRNAMLAALRQGDIDISLDLPAGFKLDPTDNMGRLSIVSMVQLSTHMFGFQCQTPPFNDKRVRQALKLLMDASAYMEKRGGTSIRARGIIPPGMLGYDAEREPSRMDIPKARKLLREAGINEGSVITFWNRNTDTGVKEEMDALFGSFSEAGLELEIIDVDAPEFWKLMRQGRLPFFRTTWIADYPDPDMFLYFLCNSKAQNLYNIGYVNDKVDELTGRAREILDKDVRAAMYREAEDLIQEDTPFIPIYHDRAFAAHKPEIHGCQLYLAPPPIRLYEIWLSEFTGRQR
ncbi:MAG: hypothetical protein GXP49_02470 [Deltaproteobacteria bacterium]|nr:hypothetical protein [Deltaproteobacteria bacterium]